MVPNGGSSTGPNDNIIRPKRRRWQFERYLPQNLAAEFSRRVFSWLYSFSLIILMLLTFGFTFVTPTDVVIQTIGSNATGVKLLIIFAADSFFVLSSLIIYFSRLIQSRIQINQIPFRSVYIPLEKNDLSRKTIEHIKSNLRRCHEIQERAGPLENHEESFDYPGMTCPEYIQQRNIELGFQSTVSLLPEGCVFQDLINTICLKFRIDGLFAGNVVIPSNFTFREVISSMAEELDDDNLLTEDLAQLAQEVIDLYEEFKFGPDLIQQASLIRFLGGLEEILLHYINAGKADVGKDHNPSLKNDSIFESSFSDRLQIVDDQRHSRASRTASDLDPFDQGSDSESLIRRTDSNWGFKLKPSNISRGSVGRKSSVASSWSERRNSQWTAFKSRLGDAGERSARLRRQGSGLADLHTGNSGGPSV